MRFRKGFSGAWIIPLCFLLDRLSKAWAVRALGTGSTAAIPGLLNWRYAENTGAVFSGFSGNALILAALTSLMIAGICAYLFAKPGAPKLLRCGLWLIVGGGACNLFDRLAYGYVVDFIEFAFVNFAVFNVADVCICAGAGITALAVLGDERRKERQDG